MTIGPVSAEAARAWLHDAEAFLAEIRNDPGLQVPEVLVTTVSRLVGEWRAAASRSTEFLWTAEVETANLRAFAGQWAGVATAVRDERRGELRRPNTTAHVFYDAMVAGVATALAEADRDAFADTFVGVMPAFDASIPSPTTRPTRVLVVDDTDDIRLLVATALDADGRFEVVAQACDGVEAIEQARKFQPDAILLDLAMPRMDGLTALPSLLACSPTSRIVVFSADHGARLDALAAGSHAFIVKGASTDDLTAALLGL